MQGIRTSNKLLEDHDPNAKPNVPYLDHYIRRAMQLYGEQREKEGAEKAISVISDAVAYLDEMAPAYYKNVDWVHDFLKDSFDKLTAQA